MSMNMHTAGNGTRKEGSNGLPAAIGNTPLVEIGLVHEVAAAARLFAKLESVNPGGSIKDRPVARMMKQAIADGCFIAGRRLLDSSSGNAGISYAMLGAVLGVPVTLVVPGNASQECLRRIRAHGADLILTDPIEGYDFAIREARRLAAAEPERYWYCDQYSNRHNWRAHYEETASEILNQVAHCTGSAPDSLVAGIGTGGTLTGVARRLREVRSALHVAAVIPAAFPGIDGLKPLGRPGDIVPALLDQSLINRRIPVRLDEAAAMCKRLAARGLFVGPSSGAFVHAALKLAASDNFHTIVTLLSDTGERYGATGMWS